MDRSLVPGNEIRTISAYLNSYLCMYDIVILSLQNKLLDNLVKHVCGHGAVDEAEITCKQQSW